MNSKRVDVWLYVAINIWTGKTFGFILTIAERELESKRLDGYATFGARPARETKETSFQRA